MKTFFSALFGFLFTLFVEGFSRIIISFFHKQEFYFFGIDSMPNTSWVIIIYLVSFLATWLGTMLCLTIADPNFKTAFKIITGLFCLWILFETLSSFKIIPPWYLVTFPITTIMGLLIAKYTYSLNKEHNAISDS